MNILRKFFTPKHSPLDTLKDLASAFAILNELESAGAFHYHPKDKALLIEETLARIEMAKGREGFHGFLNKVKDYQNYKLYQQAYESHIIEEQAKAVRDAKHKYGALSSADITRIRQHVRDTIEPMDVSRLTITAYDIYIIRANAPSAEAALREDAVSLLLAVGHYDGNTLEMSLYEDIKHNLSA